MFGEERFQPLKRVEAPSAPLETIALCHPMDYVEALREATPKQGIVSIDADTSMSPGSFEAAVRAVGGAMHAVDEVVGKHADNAFVCMRPPGHHTETVARRWASACSTPPRSPRATRRTVTASAASR